MVLTPGSLLLTHRDAPASKLITVGQRLRKYPAEVAHWSHCGIVVTPEGDIVEALGHGVVRTHISRYAQVQHRIITTTHDFRAQNRVVKFAEHAVGRRYNYLEILSLGAYLLSGTKLRFGFDNQLICSALAAESLSRTEAIFPKEPLWMVPADLALYYEGAPYEHYYH